MSVVSESGCLFCRIVAGDIPARRVYEDEHALAFLDVSPWQRGHSLVVPKRHVSDLVTGEPALAEIAPAVDAVSRLLVDRLHADGLNLVSSAKAAAGQEVFHLHVHLIPRYADNPGLGSLFLRRDRAEGDLDAVLGEITGAG